VKVQESGTDFAPGRWSSGLSVLVARLVALAALVVTLLALAPAAESRQNSVATHTRLAAGLSMTVTFFTNGTVSVALPDGTSVGTTSGSPTVIPAGAYTVVMTGPGGCAQLPLFDLKGPSENLVDDMSGGEVTSETHNAYFLPSSTYTWRLDNSSPAVVHTFVTSADVIGTPVSQGGPIPGTKVTSPPTSQDVVGSSVAPVLGKLAGGISAAGKLTVTLRGKPVGHLAAGKYALTVVDRSKTSGLTLQKGAHTPKKLSGATFVGKRSISVQLSAGRWTFATRSGRKGVAVVVA
jgi:hypothetical protein